MRLLIVIDAQGVEKIQLIHANEAERNFAHKLYLALRAEIERLDSAAKAVAGVEDDKSSPHTM
jgi:hypothetical protein